MGWDEAHHGTVVRQFTEKELQWEKNLWMEAGRKEGYARGLLAHEWQWDFVAWETNPLYHAAVYLVVVNILPQLISVALSDKLR